METTALRINGRNQIQSLYYELGIRLSEQDRREISRQCEKWLAEHGQPTDAFVSYGRRYATRGHAGRE